MRENDFRRIAPYERQHGKSHQGDEQEEGDRQQETTGEVIHVLDSPSRFTNAFVIACR